MANKKSLGGHWCVIVLFKLCIARGEREENGDYNLSFNLEEAMSYGKT